MDTTTPTTRDDSPPLHNATRTTILGSFLRGRPRNTSQSHINTDNIRDPDHQQLSLLPPQPPSPSIVTTHHRRSRPAIVTSSIQPSHSTTTPTGLGISHMLRRRRSAGTIVSPSATTSPAMPPPQAPQAPLAPPPTVLASSSSAPARPLSTFLPSTTPLTTAPNAPTAPAQTLTAPSPASGAHRIRLVPHLDSRRSLRFDAIARDLREGDPALRIGRFTDRSGMGLAAVNALGTNKLAFKSKVVSRAHAEIWVETGGRFFIKDTKSSSGSFLNHVRLSPANTESKPFQMKDGDILQLGVDYQGGTEDIYKSVKIRVEVGREWQAAPNAFNTNALKNLKTLALAPVKSAGGAAVTLKPPPGGKSQIPDCCICLFSVTIRQALFIAPCSHTFHYKCIRPLLEAHHPAFSCPLCRTFADLEEDVEVEAELGVWGESDVDVDVFVEKDNDGEREREREREREAGMETETEGDNPGPGSHRGRARSRLVDEGEALMEEDGDEIMLDVDPGDDVGVDDPTGSGSGSAGESVDNARTGMAIVIVEEEDVDVDVDGTVGGKRKR